MILCRNEDYVERFSTLQGLVDILRITDFHNKYVILRTAVIDTSFAYSVIEITYSNFECFHLLYTLLTSFVPA